MAPSGCLAPPAGPSPADAGSGPPVVRLGKSTGEEPTDIGSRGVTITVRDPGWDRRRRIR